MIQVGVMLFVIRALAVMVHTMISLIVTRIPGVIMVDIRVLSAFMRLNIRVIRVL